MIEWPNFKTISNCKPMIFRKISHLEVHRLNLDDRVKQLEAKDKLNTKRITKLENTVRDLTNKLNELTQNKIKDKNDSDVVSVSSVTSNNHSLLFVAEPYRPMLPFTAQRKHLQITLTLISLDIKLLPIDTNHL